jgi:ABC-type multidrug transport system permease subunit
LYNTSVSFYNTITNTRRNQENNTITYYKPVTNTLLYKVIIELRAFYIAFIIVVSICFYFRTKILLTLIELD